MFITSKIVITGTLTALVLTTARPIAAQSLADVAKQEEARRKSVKTPAKVITNKDLIPVPVPEASAGATRNEIPSVPGAQAGPPQKDAGDETTSKDQGTDSAGRKDQAYWSGRQKELQTQLDRDQTYADAMQTRINALTADFANRDDPAQRALIGNDRQKAISELDRLKGAIEKDKKAIADFSVEARHASVPPGWLR